MQPVSEGGGSPVLWPLVGGDQETGHRVTHFPAAQDTGDLSLQW